MIREDDDTHPDMIAAAKDLAQLVGRLRALHGNRITGGLLTDAKQLILDHRTHCRQQGIQFPVMVMVVVPRLGILELARADLDISSIAQQVVNFTSAHPTVTPGEIAEAIIGAWGIRPAELVDKGVGVRERRLLLGQLPSAADTFH
jgi:hypothetical protein